MSQSTATAIASPNIAFIKYWGNRDPILRIPQNGSISMNLAGLHTQTTIIFDESLRTDEFILNGIKQTHNTAARVSIFLDHVRSIANYPCFAYVQSQNNFPTAAGIASSAAAFAALSLAASSALQLNLDERALSRLARLGSGSACRSIPTGFVEWQAGENDYDSYAYSIAAPDHWALVDCIAIVNSGSKKIGSSEGHNIAHSSPMQASRVADAPQRLSLCRQAILQRDFDALAYVIELDCHWMHAVMMTSIPALMYWIPATLEVLLEVVQWRLKGLPVCYTMDAGANVHVLCEETYASEVSDHLQQMPSVQNVLIARCGEGVKNISH